MDDTDHLSDQQTVPGAPPMSRRERQVRDYLEVGAKLIWQRQAIFLAATLLTAFYFDPAKSFACYSAVLFTEVVELAMSRRVFAKPRHGARQVRNFVRWIWANTVLSAGAICLFIVVIALQQDVGGHFTPLFFLFAAALFAAMNNHQIVSALVLRLIMYGVTFFAITLLDIWRVRPPLDSDLWLHFFTVVFVMYFIIDCSFVFLRMYRNNLRQIEEIRAEHERTKVAYRAKSQFVSTVSHELRTPLTSIKGSLDLLGTGALGPIPDSMRSLIDIAGKNSARLANLINDILDFQKIEAGEMIYHFRPLDVEELLIEAVDANRGYAGQLGVEVHAQLPDINESVYINGDENRLMQVMANIISNAIKFSTAGGIVTVSYMLFDEKVRITVQDQGVGIPEGAKDKVFDKFSQIDSTDQRAVGGTGLGMSITKQIVDLHKGHIDYVSELGSGTTFFVDLDRVAAPETNRSGDDPDISLMAAS